MKVEYKLEPKEKVAHEESDLSTDLLRLDGADIIIDAEEGFLKSIRIVFTGLPILWETDTLINPHYYEVQIIAYKISAYLYNRILVQTGQDAFDIDAILRSNGELTPETEEESETINNHRKRVSTKLVTSYSILGSINLADYEAKYHYAEAFSNYVDGEQSSNLITKYEKYYRVIETFYRKTGTDLDQSVSNYICQFDSSYDTQCIETLRLLRNRCTHPQHKRGHINSGNVVLLRELSPKIRSIQTLAKLLLEHPPL